MNYKIIDQETYYRKEIFRHFSEDCMCSSSMTARINVTNLVSYSKHTNTKFYINFLYILSKVLNSREDYKMAYLYKTKELICYDIINPRHYVFHEDTEKCMPICTTYTHDYKIFHGNILQDIEQAKKNYNYNPDVTKYPNCFDASYISWISYDSFNIELPDGNLYFAPIINWGRYREENDKLVMPVSIRMNHAIADGYLIANVFRLLQKEIDLFVRK